MAIGQQNEDDFLLHVFPGNSEAATLFRQEILRLNLYCKRYKGAVNCILLTGETGVGKNYTTRGISAHSQWLTLGDDERRDLYYDRNGRITIAPSVLVERLLFKEHLPERGNKSERVPRLSTVLGPQLADDISGSELFGHRKFAFTGANDNHPGIFGDVALDDILLDEIADLSGKQSAGHLAYYNRKRSYMERGNLPPIQDTPEEVLKLERDQIIVKSYVGGLVKSFERRAG